MIDLGKWRLVEDAYNITLEEFREGGTLHIGKISKDRWVTEGYYPRTAKGRTYIYHRLISEGIREVDASDMKEVLSIVEDTSNKIFEWFKDEDKKMKASRKTRQITGI